MADPIEMQLKVGVQEVPPGGTTPLPLGTARTRFWESSGAKIAIVSTVVLLNSIARPYIVERFGEAIAVLAEACEWAWLAAFGIQRTDSDSLRWK